MNFDTCKTPALRAAHQNELARLAALDRKLDASLAALAAKKKK